MNAKDNHLVDFMVLHHLDHDGVGGLEDLRAYFSNKYSGKPPRIGFPNGLLFAKLVYILLFIAASWALTRYDWESIRYAGIDLGQGTVSLWLSDKNKGLLNEKHVRYVHRIKIRSTQLEALTLADIAKHPEILRHPESMVHDVCSTIAGKESMYGVRLDFVFKPVPTEPTKLECVALNRDEVEARAFFKYKDLALVAFLDLLAVVGFFFFKKFRF